MSSLLINEPPLQVLPSLAVAIGLNEAMLLQQLHYWTLRGQPSEDGHVWVYNTIEQWREQFPFWSPDTIARTLKSLRGQHVVVAERRSPNSFDKTLYYRIDRQVLDSLDTGNLRSSTPQVAPRAPQDASSDAGNLRPSEGADCKDLYTETTQRLHRENTPLPPEGAASSVEEGFAKVWNAYPKQTRRAKALEAFQAITPAPDAALVERMLGAIKRQKGQDAWKLENGRFIPGLAKWIADRRWEDGEPLPTGDADQTAPAAATPPATSTPPRPAVPASEEAKQAARAAKAAVKANLAAKALASGAAGAAP